MTKDAEARVRDELLQTLYANILRCRLSDAGSGRRGASPAADALAAGIAVNLLPGDLLLLPATGFEGFQVLLGLPAGVRALPQRLQSLGVQTQARGEAAAVAQALGAAAAAAQAGNGGLVAGFPPHGFAGQIGTKRQPTGLPSTWQAAGLYAARMALPLLLVTDRGTDRRGAGVHKPPTGPAALYPSISVDREDALASYRVSYECISRARAGNGPSHIDAIPFASLESSGSKREEQTDALGRLEAALRRRGAYSKAWHRALVRRLILELTAS